MVEISGLQRGSSQKLVVSCLTNGEWSLLPRGEIQMILSSATKTDCDAEVLDILSVAAFAAGANSHAYNDCLSGGRNLAETIKLWNNPGDDLARWYQAFPLELAKERTQATGDSSVEEYLRSLGT